MEVAEDVLCEFEGVHKDLRLGRTENLIYPGLRNLPTRLGSFYTCKWMNLPMAQNGTTKLAAGLSIFKSDSIKAGTAALTTLSPSFSLYLISFPQSFSFDARAVMSASLYLLP